MAYFYIYNKWIRLTLLGKAGRSTTLQSDSLQLVETIEVNRSAHSPSLVGEAQSQMMSNQPYKAGLSYGGVHCRQVRVASVGVGVVRRDTLVD